ncbi:BCL2 modifying factor 1 [Esox lucius]|uniref:Bcl2 modifying factor n=1 Tax=Esox lucius TaxID=8010 RepID=A0AAY5KVA7_ESOLU|nr:BCL2 modifying factor 1 [Esox lucius]
MEDEEDDVFEPDSYCWHTASREIKYEDRGTQTPTTALALLNDMLPCRLDQDPRPLFYGNAGFRLHFPAQFECVGDPGPQQRPQAVRGGMEHPQQLPQQPVARCIGQKLQLIGDQFHEEHLQLYHRNQRNLRPLWWRLASALLTLLWEQEAVAGGGRAGWR